MWLIYVLACLGVLALLPFVSAAFIGWPVTIAIYMVTFLFNIKAARRPR